MSSPLVNSGRFTSASEPPFHPSPMPASTTSNQPDQMDVDDDSSSLSSLSEHEDEQQASPTPQEDPEPKPAPNHDASVANGATDKNNFRRRSTRVVKKPTPYVEPPSTSRRSKRKRPAEDEDAGTDDNEPADKEVDASSDTAQNISESPSEAEERSSESESEVDPDDGEPDEEELKERRRKTKRAATAKGPTKKTGRGRGRPPKGSPKPAAQSRKPAAKKVKIAESVAPAPKPPKEPKKSAPKPKKGKERATNGDSEHPADDLYDAVFVQEEDHDDLARGWIAKYRQNGAEAMQELVNFVLRCCGCDLKVTNYDIEDQDSAATTLSQIQTAFQQEQGGEYPLTSKKAAFRRFRQNLTSFLESLVSELSSKDLFVLDPPLIENIQSWLAAMSTSTLRQFRHTATVIELDLMTQMSIAAADIRKTNGTTNRQLEAEGSKAIRNEARIQSLDQKLKEGEERREAIEEVIKDMFNHTFVHRYRDIDPRIRSDCVHELGIWILTLPDVFFDGSYLRYLGWVLSDSTATTRLEVTKALTKLFKKRDSASGLRHFTERFKSRLIEMATRDADASVRAAAVELLEEVRAVGYLEPEDIETVGRLLFDQDQKVRRAVVTFFVQNLQDVYQEKLEELGGEEAVEEALGDVDAEDYDGPTLHWIKMKCLVEILASYDREDSDDENDGQSQTANDKMSGIIVKVGEIVSRFTVAGAVLWDTQDEVRDWEGICRYLLYDHSTSRGEPENDADEDVEEKIKKMVVLDAREEVIILQILNASVVGSMHKGPDPPNKKKGQQPRTAKEIEKHKENVSRSLMKFIPLLLRKFGPVPDAASSVLRLQQQMNLAVFQETRQNAAYSSLLDDINRQFLTHADEGVLKEASAALMYARTFEDLKELTDAKIGELKEQTVTTLVQAVHGRDLSKAKFSDASLTQMINTVRRMEYLAGMTDCVEMMENAPAGSKANSTHSTIPIDILNSLLKRGNSVDELEEELMVRTLKTVEYYFMWKVREANASDDLSDAEIDEVIDRHGTAVNNVFDIIGKRAEADAVKVAAACTLLDLTTLFVSASNPRLAQLGKPLNAGNQKTLHKLFDDVEKLFAKTTSKKLEPDENAEPEDDEEDEDEEESEVDESTRILQEQRLCELSSKLVLGIIAGVIDIKTWKKRMMRNHTRLGVNYKEVVHHLEKLTAPPKKSQVRKGGKKAPPTKVVKAPEPEPEQEHEEEGLEEGLEEDEEENEPEELQEPEEEEEEGNDDDKESEPDPEVEVPGEEGGGADIDADGDEEMADA